MNQHVAGRPGDVRLPPTTLLRFSLLQVVTMLFKSYLKSAFGASSAIRGTQTVRQIAVGDSVPAGTSLISEFPDTSVDMPARLAGKKTIIVGESARCRWMCVAPRAPRRLRSLRWLRSSLVEPPAAPRTRARP